MGLAAKADPAAEVDGPPSGEGDAFRTPMPTIPHCDELFKRYFTPWYSDNDLSARGFDATRPDMLQCSDHVGKPAFELHIIPATHWAIKKFSDYGWDDGLVPKIHCGMHVLSDKTTAV